MHLLTRIWTPLGSDIVFCEQRGQAEFFARFVARYMESRSRYRCLADLKIMERYFIANVVMEQTMEGGLRLMMAL